MAEEDTQVTQALERRSHKARPHGQVTDNRPPLRDSNDPRGDTFGAKFELVEDDD